MTDELRNERRLAFGGVAELYERARPSYPEALVDDVIEFAGVRPGDRAVEVGAGTGKATVLFAQRGLHVVALEPDAEMAAVASDRLATFTAVSIERTDFEHWRPRLPCKLLYSAQAWHWVTPELRYMRAREALQPGGGLAVFWNRPRWDRTPLRAEIGEVYARVLGDAGPLPGPMHPGVERSNRWMSDWDASLGQDAGFAQFAERDYTWSARYTTCEYRDLLGTHSDHIVLAPSQRAALLEGISQVIEGHGGSFELPYATRLILARAGAPRATDRD